MQIYGKLQENKGLQFLKLPFLQIPSWFLASFLWCIPPARGGGQTSHKQMKPLFSSSSTAGSPSLWHPEQVVCSGLKVVSFRLSFQPCHLTCYDRLLTLEQRCTETCHCFGSSTAQAARSSSCRRGGSPSEPHTHPSHGSQGGNDLECFKWPKQT